jgi:hypothetical protein
VSSDCRFLFVFCLVTTGQSDSQRGGVARQIGHIWLPLRRKTVFYVPVHTRLPTEFGRPGSHGLDADCNDPASRAIAPADRVPPDPP